MLLGSDVRLQGDLSVQMKKTISFTYNGPIVQSIQTIVNQQLMTEVSDYDMLAVVMIKELYFLLIAVHVPVPSGKLVYSLTALTITLLFQREIQNNIVPEQTIIKQYMILCINLFGILVLKCSLMMVKGTIT